MNELIDNRPINVGEELEALRGRAGPRAGGVELLIGLGRPVDEEIVQEAALWGQHGGVNRGSTDSGDIRGGEIGDFLISGFIELAEIVGEEALEELGGIWAGEADNGAGVEAGGEWAGLLEAGLFGGEQLLGHPFWWWGGEFGEAHLVVLVVEEEEREKEEERVGIKEREEKEGDGGGRVEEMTRRMRLWSTDS